MGAEARRPGLALRGWLVLGRVLQPLLPWHLRRRCARGKEHPERWREKLGETAAARPQGRLVWLHAVGLGEVLALRGLIERLQALAPDLHFLVTSGTRVSAEVFARNMPARTLHQFAPLDAPGPARRFLAHWRPDLSVWAEQELWPGLVYRADRAGIGLALVNARMNRAAYERRARAGALYRDILPRFARISAQDDDSAAHLAMLGAPRVATDGSLKLIAPALADRPEARAALQRQLAGRPLWLAASTHAEDEALALEAHRLRLAGQPEAVLILAPRLPDRGEEILGRIAGMGLRAARRSAGQEIAADTQVYLADSYGELGLFYRIAPAAFIGGTMGDVEGHNPWEAAQLGCAILHGPRRANFAADYAALATADAARLADSPDRLAEALDDPGLAAMAGRASALTRANMDRFDLLCQKLIELL